MAIVGIQCVTKTIPAAPPEIYIPHLGIMAKAWAGLDSIPSAGEMLAQFQDAIATALAPVRRYLEIVETFSSVQQCIKAIPQAILTLNPDPIYDCLTNLAKAIARLLSWIPPLSYIRTYRTVARYCIDLIDEIFDFFVALDGEITSYINAYNSALTVGDSDLLEFIDCGMSDIVPRVTIAIRMAQFVSPINDVLLDMFLRLMPNPVLREVVKRMTSVTTYLAGISITAGGSSLVIPEFPGFSTSSVTQHAIVPVPPLGHLLYALNRSRSAIVMAHNVLSPVVGYDADAEERELPTFTNF